MKINITGNDLELTEPLKEYVNTHLASLDRLLSKYDPESVQCHVVIARTTRHHTHGDVYQAEINMTIPGKDFTAKADGSDPRAVFDEAKDKLKHELLKHKDQSTSHRS